MQIKLIAVGTKMPAWVNQGFEEYAKRLPPDCALKLIEIPAEKRTKNADTQKILIREGEKILKMISNDEITIALDIQGRSLDTPQLASQLKNWRNAGTNVNLIIGGPEGLAPACLEKASLRWSLSPLTFPHPLVRIILAEQLYRAWTILMNHPYHK